MEVYLAFINHIYSGVLYILDLEIQFTTFNNRPCIIYFQDDRSSLYTVISIATIVLSNDGSEVPQMHGIVVAAYYYNQRSLLFKAISFS